MTNTIGDTPEEREMIEKLLTQSWVNFLDANPDDLNSPDDLPDHALMTGDQFIQYASEPLESLISDRAKYKEWLAETQMLAFKWMDAHDKLKAGEPYDFPKPADLPEALADRAKLREALEALPGMLPPASDVPQDYLEGWVDAMVYAQHCLQPATTKGQSNGE